MCVTFVTCEVRVCGLRCRSGSSLYIYRVYLLPLRKFESNSYGLHIYIAGLAAVRDDHCARPS